MYWEEREYLFRPRTDVIRYRLCKDNWQQYGEWNRSRRDKKQVTSDKATVFAQRLNKDEVNQDSSGRDRAEGNDPRTIKVETEMGDCK